MNSLLFVILFTLPLVAALNEEDKAYVQKRRNEYRTELFKFIAEEKLKEKLAKVYDDFIACNINSNGVFDRITTIFPTFYKDETTRKRNLLGLASIFIVFDSMEKARVCKKN